MREAPARKLHLVPQEKMKLGDSISQITPDEWLTASKMAKLAGMSKDTLKRWRLSGLYKPTGSMQVGKITVNLYSIKDVDKLKAIAKANKPGRKPKVKKK